MRQRFGATIPFHANPTLWIRAWSRGGLQGLNSGNGKGRGSFRGGSCGQECWIRLLGVRIHTIGHPKLRVSVFQRLSRLKVEPRVTLHHAGTPHAEPGRPLISSAGPCMPGIDQIDIPSPRGRALVDISVMHRCMCLNVYWRPDFRKLVCLR